MQRYKPDGTEVGEPYYAPKEEPLHAKDSAQLRKIEERDKQIKYAKKLGESVKSDNGSASILILHRGATGSSFGEKEERES
jgi:hypothetical protein